MRLKAASNSSFPAALSTRRVETILLWIFVFQLPILTIGPDTWREETLVLMTLATAAVTWRHWRYSFRSSRLLWVGVAGLAGWMVIQELVVSSGSNLWGFKGGATLAASFGAALAISILNRDGQHNRTLWIALTVLEFFVVFQLIISFLFAIGEFYSYRSGSVRAFGFLSDSISPIVGFFVIKNALERRHARCFLTAFALAITGGKMAWGITIAGLFVLPFLGRGFWRLLRNVLIACVTAYVCLQASFALDIPPNKFADLKVMEEEERLFFNKFKNFDRYCAAPGSNRFLSFVAALDMARRHPLVGVGFNRSRDQIPEVAAKDPFNVNNWSKVKAIHNSSLLILAELGLIGLGLFCVMCIGMFAVFIKTVVGFCQSGEVSRDTLTCAAAAAVWGMAFILLYQTTGWIQPGHPQLIWLVVCIGIAGAEINQRTVGCPTRNTVSCKT